MAQHADAFASAEGLLGSSEKVDAALLEKMPKLRATSTVSVGYDNFDVDALNARNILLMHTPHALTETVADTLMALVLSTARRSGSGRARESGRMDQKHWPGLVRRGRSWQNAGDCWDGPYRSGAGTARAFGFNMPILYNARRHHSEAEERFNALYCELDTLLREADFVCLILPLTDETRHLIGKAAFEKMKKSAIFINAGRGPVVDEKALIEALQNGEIHAAGLDVFEQEPLPVDSPLLTMPNVVALPTSALRLMKHATTWRRPPWIT